MLPQRPGARPRPDQQYPNLLKSMSDKFLGLAVVFRYLLLYCLLDPLFSPLLHPGKDPCEEGAGEDLDVSPRGEPVPEGEGLTDTP